MAFHALQVGLVLYNAKSFYRRYFGGEMREKNKRCAAPTLLGRWGHQGQISSPAEQQLASVASSHN
ncbi:hypothetical protein PROFUN_14404 [Planoprotostelium fungivorum]|uniref:Uncharacterized protein n=1 Tax=Planoprotostelium fungivorum TaxID=1890364 RepID=A0A2P6N0A6_9EUKA|nr:hypothetical protein PROFUN_14404 [Planoprotostelium fungivorum]